MAENRTEYNKLSDKLKAAIEKRIKDNGPVFNFKLSTARILRMPTMQAGVFTDRSVWNATYGLPNTDIINDEGEQKNLAVIQYFDANSMPVHENRFVMAEATNGTFSLNNDIPEDSKWLWLYLASNYVENNCNPKKIPGKVIMRIVDDVADARSENERLDKKEAAMLAAAGMDEQARIDFAAAMNWDQTEKSEVLKSKIRRMADEQPEFFTSFLDKGYEFRALLKKAIDAKIVNYEPTTNELKWSNGESIATLAKESGKNELDKFQDWVLTHPNGQKIADSIRTQLGKAKIK